MGIFSRKDNQKRFRSTKAFGLFAFLFGKLKPTRWAKWQRFFKNEKREIRELTRGQQDLSRFYQDSNTLLKDMFIPSERNNHKPMVLRPKSLMSFVLAALVVKLTVAGFLFATYPSEAELSAIISANMLSLINEARVEAAVAPLVNNETLANFAKVKGNDMIARDYFAHNTPDGKKPWEWIDRSQYDYVYAGENLAMDFITAEVVQEAFMKSPSHRKNILNSKYHDAGIAVVEGELEGHKTTLLVEFFGTQRKDYDAGFATGDGAAIPVVAKDTTPTVSQTADIAGASTQLPPGAPAVRHTTVVAEPDSPTPGPINEGIIVVSTAQQGTKSIINEVIQYSNILFLAFLLFIGVALLLNVFIKIQIQHTSVILQSMVVLALLAAMLLVKFHFVETVAPQLLIL